MTVSHNRQSIGWERVEVVEELGAASGGPHARKRWAMRVRCAGRHHGRRVPLVNEHATQKDVQRKNMAEWHP
jgi:hypothetical protein